MPLTPSLKLRIPLPRPFMSSGIFLPPKNSRAINTMKIISWVPIPNIITCVLSIWQTDNRRRFAAACPALLCENPGRHHRNCLIEKYHRQHKRQWYFLPSVCSKSGGNGQQYGFKQDGGEWTKGRHPEHQGIDKRWSYRRHQSGFPSVFISTDKSEEIDGKVGAIRYCPLQIMRLPDKS